MEKLLRNSKIMIWGTGRFAKDFLYAFDELEIAYQMDSTESEKLEAEDKNTCLVIICEYEPAQAMKILDRQGWEYKKNYVLADDLFYLMDYPIEQKVEGRKVYIWGTSGAAHNFFHEVVEKRKEITVVGCIDNNSEKQSKIFFGRPIYAPEEVVKQKDIFIIVASTFYFKIREELTAMGLRENIDFTHYHKVNQTASIMLRQTIYDVPSLDHVCMKPFSYAALTASGTMALCAAIPVNTESLLFDDFQEIWNSNIAKILRLSMINRTCTFCRDKRCIFLLNNANPFRDCNELHYEMHYEISGTLSPADYNRPLYPKNQIINEDDYKIKPEKIPTEVMVSIDKSCNLYCESCRKERYLAKNEDLEKVEWMKKIVEKEIVPGVEYIRLAGDGEVFFSPVYRSLLANEAIKKKKKIGILSNGTMFTPEAWELVKGEHECIKCVFSIDAPTKVTYEKLRRGASFERMVKNMEFASELRRANEIQEFSIHCVVQRANYLEMEQYVKWGLSLGVDQIEFVHIVNYGTYSQEDFKKVTMLDDNNKWNEDLKKVLDNPIFKNEKVNLFGWRTW